MYRDCAFCGKKFLVKILVGDVRHCSMKCAMEEALENEKSRRKVQPQVQQGKSLR
jgi:hypothetical protein